MIFNPLPLSQTVTLSQTPSPPLERDILYGRPLLDLLSEFGLISDGWLGSISPLEIGPMHLIECWMSPSLRLVIPGIAVSPGVTHSDSHHFLYDTHCRETSTTTTTIGNRKVKIWEWSWSLSLRLVYPVLHKPPGATITSRSAAQNRINFWRMVGLYISLEDWSNALECWRSPSLRLVIPWTWIAVSPGLAHSESHHLLDMTLSFNFNILPMRKVE